jgi:hypothetical protein
MRNLERQVWTSIFSARYLANKTNYYSTKEDARLYGTEAVHDAIETANCAVNELRLVCNPGYVFSTDVLADLLSDDKT